MQVSSSGSPSGAAGSPNAPHMAESGQGGLKLVRRRDRLGAPLTWLCGGALAVNLVLVAGLIGLIAVRGFGHFWQVPIVALTLEDGSRVLGEPWGVEEIPGSAGATRSRIKTGNRDVTGRDFVWLDDARVRVRAQPADAVVIERREWGNFYGTPVELRRDGLAVAHGPAGVLDSLAAVHARALAEFDAIQGLERGEMASLNRSLEELRLDERRLALGGSSAGARAQRQHHIEQRRAVLEREYQGLATEVADRRQALGADVLVMRTIDGDERGIPVAEIVRLVPANQLGPGARIGLYLERLREFVAGEPRESNTEGGVFPAIFGTVLMVVVLSLVVAPLGVLAALYLREYAPEGAFVRVVRIAVSNLAGVPSIVFGVFGLGFFVYTIGGTIDELFFPEALPTPTFGTGGILWASLTLAVLTVPVVIVATEEGLAAVPRALREGSLALGATKFETVWHVVLPAAAPGFMTGLILAMARAAGEVAPLMIVGMVKLAPALPIDGQFPFFHPERKFMHLGFHIYDVGFQSPNVEAAEPLVFATALLLVLIVSLMNLVAIVLRNRLRERYATSAV